MPGPALFHGAMVAAECALNMITMTFGSVALVGCIRVVHGHSASFGDSIGGAGLLYGGGLGLLGTQVVGAFAVLFHSFGVTWLIATVLDKTMGLRVRPEVEQEGVDVHLHAESAYDLTHPSPATEPVPAPGGVTRRVVAVAGVRARGFP